MTAQDSERSRTRDRIMRIAADLAAMGQYRLADVLADLVTASNTTASD